jgi:hypothetical protein
MGLQSASSDGQHAESKFNWDKAKSSMLTKPPCHRYDTIG